MSLESLVARGQVAAEKLFLDTCTIRYKTGETTGAGGVITDVMATRYSGRCRLKSEKTVGRDTEVGEDYMIIGRRVLQLPIEVTGISKDDKVTITASRLDPDLPGRVYVVREPNRGSTAIYREVTLIEVTS